ncbi:MAG: cobalt transporter CbiM [Bacteroidales bacterium]|nr:cobalt transporter CbiM [Bacteroidales bacterium]
MHIPDGYLSPQTYIPLYGGFVVLAAVAAKYLKKTMHASMVPFMGMAAAFSFIIMMFNIPIPGGTTGHAVGGGIISVLFGPWVAFVAVSVALIIQAFVFGDGGITAIGANCFNIAFIMPFVAWYIFRIIAGTNPSERRQLVAVFTAGWLSLNMAAFFTALELGIQPLIAVGDDGNPLYAPYPLKIALPAMMIEHLLLFGIIEGLVSVFIYRYFLKHHPEMIAAKNRS